MYCNMQHMSYLSTPSQYIHVTRKELWRLKKVSKQLNVPRTGSAAVLLSVTELGQ